MPSSFSSDEFDLSALVGEVADDFLQRQAEGDHPDVEEYTRRHPQAASVLRKVLSSLQLLDLSHLEKSSTESPRDTLSGTLGDFRI